MEKISDASTEYRPLSLWLGSERPKQQPEQRGSRIGAQPISASYCRPTIGMNDIFLTDADMSAL